MPVKTKGFISISLLGLIIISLLIGVIIGNRLSTFNFSQFQQILTPSKTEAHISTLRPKRGQSNFNEWCPKVVSSDNYKIDLLTPIEGAVVQAGSEMTIEVLTSNHRAMFFVNDSQIYYGELAEVVDGDYSNQFHVHWKVPKSPPKATYVVKVATYASDIPSDYEAGCIVDSATIYTSK